MHHCTGFIAQVTCFAQVWCRPRSPPGALHHQALYQVPCHQLYKEVMHYHIIFIDYLTCSPVLPSMAPDLSPGCPAYGINNTMGDSDQRIWNAYLHAGSDVITQVSATHPALNPYEDSQKSSPAAVQTWPLVAGAQGSAPMDLEASPQGSGVERQPPIPRDYTEALNFGGDFANPSAGPTAPGASRERCGDEWTGTLYWNLNAVCARTQASVRNPHAHSFRGTSINEVLHPRRMLSAWPKHLQLEPVFDSQINILDIQTWLLETRAPVVRLSGIDNMDKHHFSQLVETLKSGRGVSLPSSRLPILTVSRFDSTQL